MYADFHLVRKKWRKDKYRVSFWDRVNGTAEGYIDLTPEQLEAIWGMCLPGFYDDKRDKEE